MHMYAKYAAAVSRMKERSAAISDNKDELLHLTPRVQGNNPCAGAGAVCR